MVRGLFVPADGNMKVEQRDYRTLEDYRAAVGGWIEAVDVPSFGPVYQLIHQQKLPTVLIGSRRRVPSDALATFVQELRAGAAHE